MAAIPQPDELAKLIYNWHANQNAKDWRRPHFGGSMVAKECSRELFYKFRWVYQPPPIEGRMFRLFKTGFLAEDRFIEELTGVGLRVWAVDPDTSQQFKITAAGGHVMGFLDGIGREIPQAPKTPHLLEMKTHNNKSFQKLKAEGVRKSKPEHAGQMEIYGYKMDLTRALYIASNKDNDEIYTERLHLTKTEGKRLETRAHNIIFTDHPPEKISQDPAFFKCKFCDYAHGCHNNKAPETNCRTCAFITPKEDAQWHCEHHGKTLTTQEQREGCEKHLFNPALMPIKATQFDPTVHVMEYESGLQNGKRGILNAIPSKELSVIDDLSVLNDEGLKELINNFDGQFTK